MCSSLPRKTPEGKRGGKGKPEGIQGRMKRVLIHTWIKTSHASESSKMSLRRERGNTSPRLSGLLASLLKTSKRFGIHEQRWGKKPHTTWNLIPRFPSEVCSYSPGQGSPGASAASSSSPPAVHNSSSCLIWIMLSSVNRNQCYFNTIQN